MIFQNKRVLHLSIQQKFKQSFVDYIIKRKIIVLTISYVWVQRFMSWSSILNPQHLEIRGCANLEADPRVQIGSRTTSLERQKKIHICATHRIHFADM